MTYDESEKNIILALEKLDSIRNNLNSTGKSQEQCFEKFRKACEIFKCAGQLSSSSVSDDEERYFDASNNILAKYFVSKNEKSNYNDIFNTVNFLLAHQGTSEQFATALSMLFVSSKRIKCYPVRVKLTLKTEDQLDDGFVFINFIQILDDSGSFIYSCYVDLLSESLTFVSFDEFANMAKEKYSNENQTCLKAEFDGMNIYPDDINLKNNFTIFETLTDQGGVQFNYMGYEVDISTAAVELCTDLSNYISKKELSNHMSSYLKQ